MANWYILRATRGLSSDRERDARTALDMTRRALDADPYDSLALAVEGFVHCHLFKDLDTAQRRCEEALAANPNQALAWLYKGVVHAFRGEGVAATESARRALTLSPLDPQRYYFDSLAATAAIAARDYVRAEHLARASLRLNRMHSSTWRMLTVALYFQGKLEAARLALGELRRLEPDLTVSSYLRRVPHGNSIVARDWARAMADCGLPHGA
jgi:adenylate cyclase